MRRRDEASTRALTPLPGCAAAAEPPTTRAVRQHGLLVPATHRETKRGPANDPQPPRAAGREAPLAAPAARPTTIACEITGGTIFQD